MFIARIHFLFSRYFLRSFEAEILKTIEKNGCSYTKTNAAWSSLETIGTRKRFLLQFAGLGLSKHILPGAAVQRTNKATDVQELLPSDTFSYFELGSGFFLGGGLSCCHCSLYSVSSLWLRLRFIGAISAHRNINGFLFFKITV